MMKNRRLPTVAFATVLQFVTLFGSGVTARAQTASPSPAPGETPSPLPVKLLQVVASSSKSPLPVTLFRMLGMVLSR